MADIEKEQTNPKDKPDSSSSQVKTPLRIPLWLIYAWGGCTVILGILFVTSFLVKSPQPEALRHVDPLTHPITYTAQTVWNENFDNTQLEGWKMDWVNLQANPSQPNDSSDLSLFAYHNMLPDKRNPIKYTFTPGEQRYFYAQSPTIPIDYTKPYTVSFDYHGKGPMELIDFGAIRLRLLENLPVISYDMDGTKTYRTLSTVNWTPDQLNMLKHSFRISVTPATHSYEIWIDDTNTGKVNYSEKMNMKEQIFFYEIPSSTPNVNPVFYDNMVVIGVPSKELSSFNMQSPTPQAIEVSAKYKEYYKTGWDKYNEGEFQTAVGYFKQAINENPKSAEAYNALGIAYRASGDTTNAWQAWISALNVDSTYLPAKQNLGVQ